MTKIDERVEELLAKHPSLTKLEAIRIVTEKNERKQKKRAEKTDRSNAKKNLGTRRTSSSVGENIAWR